MLSSHLIKLYLFTQLLSCSSHMRAQSSLQKIVLNGQRFKKQLNNKNISMAIKVVFMMMMNKNK